MCSPFVPLNQVETLGFKTPLHITFLSIFCGETQKPTTHRIGRWCSNTCSTIHHTSINSSMPSDAYMRQWITHHWYRSWLVAWPAPSHYLNQCWDIVNSNLRYKPQWNLKRNSYIFIQENVFENVFWKTAAILSRPQCVNKMFLAPILERGVNPQYKQLCCLLIQVDFTDTHQSK